MLLFDVRGVAYSYESTVPAPLLPSSDQSNNLPQSNKAPPMVDARSGECPRTDDHELEKYLIRNLKSNILSKRYFLLYIPVHHQLGESLSEIILYDSSYYWRDFR